MKTLIELFDESPILNVLASVAFKPEKLIFFGADPLQVEESRGDYNRFFKSRGENPEIEYISADMENIDEVNDTLAKIISENPDCVVDVTGGKDIALLAAGMAAVKLGVPLIAYNRRWSDGLYMVMPVMTKMYKLTGNPLYLEKLHEYWTYANSIMYDSEEGLYYRDGKYIYPKHKSVNGKKDFWARGDGWVLAALAKVLKDLPETDQYRQEYIDRFQTMAKSVAACQQPEGYWTRSMLDPEHAPGPETSGTAFFTYGLLWGMNNGLLDKAAYQPVVMKEWNYLTTVALQPDGRIGYVQPIGEKAIPGQVVDANSTANFGVGAFLLAACEMVRFLNAD